jgi:hypothetical protein
MEALRVARGWGSHIFRHSAHRWRWGCHPYAPAAFYPPGRFLVLISVRGWVKPRAIVRLEGLGQLKKSTSSMITGNLPTCSIVPLPTTLLHAPGEIYIVPKEIKRHSGHVFDKAIRVSFICQLHLPKQYFHIVTGERWVRCSSSCWPLLWVLSPLVIWLRHVTRQHECEGVVALKAVSLWISLETRVVYYSGDDWLMFPLASPRQRKDNKYRHT